MKIKLLHSFIGRYDLYFGSCTSLLFYKRTGFLMGYKNPDTEKLLIKLLKL